MDGVSAILGIAASIPALIAACKTCIDMAQTMKDAYEDCRMLSYELCNLQALLYVLDDRMRTPQSPISKDVASSQEEMPLERMRVRLELLAAKLTPKKRYGAFNRLRWYLNEDYVKDLLQALERDKLLINLAIQADTSALEHAARSDVQNVHTFLCAMDKKIDSKLDKQNENISNLAQIMSQENDRARAKELIKEKKEILQWLSTSDEDKHLGMKRERKGQSAPGGWLLGSKSFSTWATGDRKILHCFGKPGSGKTMICSCIIEHLEDENPETPVASVFCDSSKASIFTEEDLLRSILRQFLARLPELPSDVLQAYAQKRDSEKYANPDTVEDALEKFLQQRNRVYIVIDALDEFGDDSFARQEMISSLMHLLKHDSVKLLVTSVTGTIALDNASSLTEMEIQANDDDIRDYLTVVLQKPSLNTHVKDLMDNIIERISVVAEGVFLSARILVDEICHIRRPTRNKILAILNDPPKPLAQRYDEALRRIGDAEDILDMLGWLARARRDLTKKELLDALAVREGTEDIDKDDVTTINDLVQSSAGLVYVEDSGVVRLLHRTLREHLWESTICAKSELKITKACLTYLSYDNCTQQLNEHNKLPNIERKYPLLKYAARYWGDHYKGIAEEDRVTVHAQMLTFANKPYRVADAYMGHWTHRNALQKALRIWKGETYNQDRRSLHLQSGPRPRARWSGAHYAIFFGSLPMLKFFAQNGVDLHQNPDRTGSLLGLAAALDRVGAAEYLIDQGVDVGVRDWDGSFPLFRAVESGSLQMVKTLIDAGCDVHQNARDHQKTPLHQACFHDRADVVDLLWQHGASTDIDVGHDDERVATPLAYVMDKDRERCQELLLFKHKALTPYNAIGLPVPIESAGLLKRLLEEGTDPNQTFGLGQGALDVALRLRDPTLIKLCIDRGAVPKLFWKDDDPSITTLETTESWHNSLKTLLRNQRKPYHSTSRTEHLICEDHRLQYLQIQIPPDQPAPKRIMFTITSADQGWSSYPETWGAYRGSQTFFVARIYETSGDDETGLKAVLGPRYIVRNIHASSQPKTHTVMWDSRDKKKGWAKWMAEMTPGRIVHVNARSAGKGLAWENHVYSVSVDLFHE